ncbi:hypothetical protein PSHT_03284, partial [Puccinia striiformis]
FASCNVPADVGDCHAVGFLTKNEEDNVAKLPSSRSESTYVIGLIYSYVIRSWLLISSLVMQAILLQAHQEEVKFSVVLVDPHPAYKAKNPLNFLSTSNKRVMLNSIVSNKI